MLIAEGALKDLTAPVGVQFGEDVVEQHHRGTSAAGEEGGLGKPEGEGKGAGLAPGGVEAHVYAVNQQLEVVSVGADHGGAKESIRRFIRKRCCLHQGFLREFKEAILTWGLPPAMRPRYKPFSSPGLGASYPVGTSPDRQSFSRLWVRATKVNSPAALAIPRSRNCRIPRACLISPWTGSVIALRRA